MIKLTQHVSKVLVAMLAVVSLQCSDQSTYTDSEGRRFQPIVYEPPARLASGDWETLLTTSIYSDAPVFDAAGNLYYAEIAENRIYKISPTGEASVFDENTARSMGLAFAPDGRLIACRNFDAQIVAYDMQGGREVLLQGDLSYEQSGTKGEFCNGLVVSSAGDIWFNDRINEQIIYLAPTGRHQTVARGFRPNGIILSRDESMLITTDSNAPRLWAFEILPDGELREIPEFFAPVRMGKNRKRRWVKPGTNGMTVDQEGRYYVTSFLGIQVYDSQGNMLGLIRSPAKFLSDVTIGGPNNAYLYATGRGGLYRIPIPPAGGSSMVQGDR
jgi:gluconolactonase